jgi:hypothetical protein
MDSDVEQLGRIVAAVMLAGVGVFLLLQALRGRLIQASSQVNDGEVKAAAPVDRSTMA